MLYYVKLLWYFNIVIKPFILKDKVFINGSYLLCSVHYKSMVQWLIGSLHLVRVQWEVIVPVYVPIEISSGGYFSEFN